MLTSPSAFTQNQRSCSERIHSPGSIGATRFLQPVQMIRLQIQNLQLLTGMDYPGLSAKTKSPMAWNWRELRVHPVNRACFRPSDHCGQL